MTHIHRFLLGLFVALVSLVALSAPAGAHTGFEASDPADGATVDEPVGTVTLVFTGPAEPAGAGFQVLDPSGALREPVEASSPDGSTWVLRFEPPLAGGAVGVRWRVKAPDAHPIEGSFRFVVAAPAPGSDPVQESDGATGGLLGSEAVAESSAVDDSGAADLEAFLDTDGDQTTTARVAGAAARSLTLFGTLVGIGALVFAAVVLRGDRRDVRHVLHWVRRAGVIVVIGAAVELLAQVALEAGGDWSAAWSLSGVGSVVGSSFGAAIVLRIAGGVGLVAGARLDVTPATEVHDPVVVLTQRVGVGARAGGGGCDDGDGPDRHPGVTAPLVHRGDDAWEPTVGSIGAVLGAVALVASHLFDGHTVSKGERISTGLLAVVHVASGAVWAGGVMMLAVVLWRRHRQGRELRALQLALRFSVVATIALVAVAVAGAGLTVIVLDAPSELWSTPWGRVLIVKTVFVAGAAAIGGYNHRVLIPRLERSPADLQLARRLRSTVTGEAVALLAVTAATALLMGAAS